MHPWPRGIVGIVIDAKGVEDAKENPAIAFEYMEGFTPPPPPVVNNKRNPKPQLRTLATGSTVATPTAVKRKRIGAVAVPSTASGHTPSMMADTPTTLKGQQPTELAPVARVQQDTATDPRVHQGSPPFRNTPIAAARSPAGQHSQYFAAATPTRDDGPPPPLSDSVTPPRQIQVSASSGRKLPPHDPNSVARVQGVDDYQ